MKKAIERKAEERNVVTRPDRERKFVPDSRGVVGRKARGKRPAIIIFHPGQLRNFVIRSGRGR